MYKCMKVILQMSTVLGMHVMNSPQTWLMSCLHRIEIFGNVGVKCVVFHSFYNVHTRENVSVPIL